MANLFNAERAKMAALNSDTEPEEELFTPFGSENLEPAPAAPKAAIAVLESSPTAPAGIPPREEAIPVTTPAAPKNPKAPKKERVRKPESGEKKKIGRPRKTEQDTHLTAVQLPCDLHDLLLMNKIRTKVSVTDTIIKLCADMADGTYECREPACFHRFLAVSDSDGSFPAPRACPFCGSTKIKKIKFREGGY